MYAHAAEEGWVQPGDWILDPFGGVSLGAHDALLAGYHVVHCELEATFHQLAQQNVALWRRRYGHLPGYGTAVLLQGDSRFLGTLLGAQVACVVANPPFADTLSAGPRVGNATAYTGHHGHDYGSASGQLGALPPGSVDAVLSSPPYADGCAHTGGRDLHAEHVTGGPVHHVRYGQTPGQLADMVVSSPPFGQAQKGGGLSAVRAGGTYYATTRLPGNCYQPSEQGTSPGQLANEQPATFWEAAAAIVAQVVALLKDGGHCMWVTKNYIREKKEVPFTQDWIRLCTSAGLTLLHHHQAMLVETHGTQTTLFGADEVKTTRRESFFRRLARQKTGLAIEYESVTCFVKRGGTGRVEMCVASPPFNENPRASSLERARVRENSCAQSHGGPGPDYLQITSPGNLGNLRPGSVDCVVSSPPYNLPMSQDHNGHRGGVRGTTPSEPGAFAKYGNTPGQLEGMPPGSVDLVVSSPPYSGNEKHDYRVTDEQGYDRDERRGRRQGKGCFRGSETYGREAGNLGNLPPGQPPCSPPSPVLDSGGSRG